ncbi:MAG: nucleotide pyrophosphohydrolase [Lachnospiraceae bacterium]|nr:nucleotide pyrophosphohydrolase [Ruminococcus sp.]MCM1276190.1 nucleotide pyrophosphohydrolase [Lachnospiraceae bacterium]
MDNFGFNEMQAIQRELREKYKDKWGELYPEKAIGQLLWLYGELGEVSDVIKKNGSEAILNDKAVRGHFIEELCDVMMYFNDIMLCYSVSPEELREAYLKKHEINMSRWYVT